MIRNTHRVGRYLLVDDESGKVMYDDEAVVIWDGSVRHRSNWEARNPQEFVKAKNDPVALDIIRPDQPYPTAENVLPSTIGNTNIAFPTGGPAGHLFGGGGIGIMAIEDENEPFIVA